MKARIVLKAQQMEKAWEANATNGQLGPRTADERLAVPSCALASPLHVSLVLL